MLEFKLINRNFKHDTNNYINQYDRHFYVIATTFFFYSKRTLFFKETGIRPSKSYYNML